MDGNTPDIGHNRGPAFNPEVVAAFAEQAAGVSDAAAAWAGAQITSDTKAGELKDFLDQCRALWKEVEDRRKAEKEPHLSAGREVDQAFKGITAILERAASIAKKPLQAYLLEKQREEDARRRAAEAEAAERAAEAERAAQIAERNQSAAAQIEAEEAARAAEEAQRIAQAPAKAKVASATGAGTKSTGLRTRRLARIDNIRHAFMHYQDHPDVTECIQRLANADIRAAKGEPITIPGITIIEEKTL